MGGISEGNGEEGSECELGLVCTMKKIVCFLSKKNKIKRNLKRKNVVLQGLKKLLALPLCLPPINYLCILSL